MPAALHIPFDNRYVQLPGRFYARVLATPVSAPRLLRFNTALAAELGIVCEDPEALDVAALLAGNAVPAGAEPLAQAYAGHQFGHLNPRLGDGRALLLGEVVDSHGRRRDIQLKGAGRTPFSRGGDGRAPLGPVLREYLVSEAMHALGIPTTRALAAVLTGDRVMRERPEPGAILTRVAASHIRIGTFEYFALQDDRDALRHLLTHVIGRHYPEIDPTDPRAPLQLLEGVCRRQADLVAHWMLVGFVHGVMNTDNMTVSGETIDYGPCAFIDRFDPGAVFSFIDQQGRYAWKQQPGIAQWNLARLAESLLPLIDADESRAITAASTVLDGFRGWHNAAWLAGMRAKLGLSTAEAGDTALADQVLGALTAGGIDHTVFFRTLSRLPARGSLPTDLSALAEASEASQRSLVGVWEAWIARCQREPLAESERQQRMQACNPALIPRNHCIAEVIAAATEGDMAPFHRLNEALAAPFTDGPDTRDLQQPPAPHQRVCTTFCGT